jgi:UPF0716 protein FxsA
MRFIIVLCLLAFPIVEIALLIGLASEYGWKVLLYIVVVALLGLRLISDEKQMLTGRVMQSLMGGEHPVKAIFGSARNIIAGILLVIPGVITDVIAVILLLVPVKRIATPASPGGPQRQAANDDVIEGEFRRED